MSLTTRFGVAFGAVLLAVFAATAALVTATPAHAHDQVASASPAEGESLAAAPTEISIEFVGIIQNITPVLTVTDAAGAEVTTGDVELNARTITRAVLPDLPNGQYQVVWSVLSEDGHRINDAYHFAIGEPVAADQHTEHADETAGAEQSATVNSAKSADTAIDWGRIVSFALIGAFGGIAIYAAILALIRRTKNNSERK